MKIRKNYFLAALFFCSLSSEGQSIEPSLLSQLTPEQIEMAKEVYAGNNSTDLEIDDLPVINETLAENRILGDSNQIAGQKFGYNFFSSMPTSLTAVGDLPLPNDYKISLRDQLRIILSGSKDSIFDLNVKLDGTILFPELGSISVVGLTFKEVKEKLSQKISQSYIGVSIDVSIQNLSAKKITIVGAVKTPGTYLINPFSTITSALAYSGGISEIGSLREIKLIRNNGKIFTFDLYDLLIKGDRSGDLNIEAGDTILIGPAKQFVEISGAIRRPAIYELVENETLEDIVNFALGFEQTANQTNISVSVLDLKTASVLRKITSNLNDELKDATSVAVFNYISDQKSNIQVIGAVEKPGFYDLDQYSMLEDLISDLNFIDVYPWLGVLEQFDENALVKSSILFSLRDKSTYKSIKLLPNSKVYFSNLDDKFSMDVDPLSRASINEYSLRLRHKGISYSFPVSENLMYSNLLILLVLI